VEKDAHIYVAGHRGLVGSALVRRLTAAGYTNLITRSHAELDLTNQHAVKEFFNAERPEYVFLAAAKVGGIHANATCPAEFIHQNLAIQTNVIHESWRTDVERLLFLGSSCIYPRDCPQPIKEEYLLTGLLEPTNRPYAVAKIAGIEMCWAYNRQYGTKFLAVMPTNLYGPGDNFDPENSHVIPALIRRFHEAKVRGDKEVVVWGTGMPRREFLYSDDLADACVFLMELPDDAFAGLMATEGNEAALPVVNIGSGDEITVSELAELIRKTADFAGALDFDPRRPDGTPRNLLDTRRLRALGWRATTALPAGLGQAYRAFLSHSPGGAIT
jgi:GDP-L-fucose synthase